MPSASDARELSWSRAAQLAAAALFLAVIALPLLDTLFHFAPETALGENRSLKKYPQLHWKSGSLWKRHLWRELAKFPADFDAAFSDRFGFRATLVRLDGAIKIFAFRLSPTPRVVIGKNGWLYYDLAAQNAAERQPGAAAARWRQEIEAKAAWCHARGIAYLFVLMPVKETIYPENVPAGLLRAPPTLADQLAELLRTTPSVSSLDLRGPLRSARRLSPDALFYRTDTHWTDHGALIGCREIIARLQPMLPDVTPPDVGTFAWKRETVRSMNLAKMLGFGQHFPEATWLADSGARLSKVTNAPWLRAYSWTPDRLPSLWLCRSAANQRRLVFCSDSFGAALAPLLANAYARTAYARSEFPINAAFHAFQETLLAAEQPDVLIELVSEQHLSATPVHIFGSAKKDERPAKSRSSTEL